MTIKEQIIESYYDEQLMFADGFDEAILGIDINSLRIIYSKEKCIEILMKDMSEEDATEYFYYNVASAWMGDKTPIYCETIFH